MSLPLLAECLDEVRRVAAAGSDVAPGNKRLARCNHALAKAASPFLKRVASAVGELVNGSPKSSARNLLTASVLLHMGHFARGSHKIEGEFEPIAPSPFLFETKLPVRRLKQLIKILKKTNGWLDVPSERIKDFKDLRLILPAVRALSSPAVGEFVATEVMPLYGPAILPLVLDGLDHCRGESQQIRLSVVRDLGLIQHKQLFFKLIESGSIEAKLEAIEALKAFPEAVPILENLATRGSKRLRAAAVGALAELNPGTAGPLILAMLEGSASELAIDAAEACDDPDFVDALCERLEEAVALLKKRSNPVTDNRARQLLVCLRNKSSERAKSCLMRLWDTRNRVKAAKSSCFIEALPDILLSLNDPRADERLVAARFDLEVTSSALAAGERILSASQMFDVFSPLLFNDEYKQTIVCHFWGLSNDSIKTLDPRWKKALFEIDEIRTAADLLLGDDEELFDLILQFVRQADGDMSDKTIALAAALRAAPDRASDTAIQFISLCDDSCHGLDAYGWDKIFFLLPHSDDELASFGRRLKSSKLRKALEVALGRRLNPESEE